MDGRHIIINILILQQFSGLVGAQGGYYWMMSIALGMNLD
jgi:hypothetical protein